MAVSCLAKPGCYQLLRAGITRRAVLRGSLCLCIVVERCDLTDIKEKIHINTLMDKRIQNNTCYTVNDADNKVNLLFGLHAVCRLLTLGFHHLSTVSDRTTFKCSQLLQHH